jgi:xylulokinase
MTAAESAPDDRRVSDNHEVAVCAVDVGTSAVRARLVNDCGQVIAASRRNRSGQTPGQFDPEALWSVTASAVREVISTVPVPSSIKAVGIAGLIGTVLVDDQLRPVVAGSDWSDGRGIELLQSRPREAVDSLLSRTLRPAATASALALLLWLRQHQAEDIAGLRWVLSPKDYLNARLSGAVATDVTSAAYTLLLDVRARMWSAFALDFAGLRDIVMPHPHYGSDVIGQVTPAGSAETGLAVGTLVIAGGPDGTLGAVGLIGTNTGTVVDIGGTTDMITQFGTDESAAIPRHAVCNPHPEPGWWAYGGPTGVTGGAADWAARLVGFRDAAAAGGQLAALSSIPPGSNGLLALPFLSGSRFPRWNAAERAALLGLNETHGPMDVIRAFQEAGAFAAREGIDELDPAGTAKVVLAGGVARSDALVRLRADIIGRPIDAYESADASLRGVGVLAAVGAGLQPDVAAAAAAVPASLTNYKPDPVRVRAYDHLYARWMAARKQHRHDQHR